MPPLTNIKAVYLAAAYEHLPFLRDIAFLIESTGRYRSCSRWLTGSHEPENITDDHRAKWAEEDFQDICECDFFVMFNDGRPTPGRNTELGYAIALKKSCLIIGHRSSIFHYHERCTGLQDAKALLNYFGVVGKLVREKPLDLSECRGMAGPEVVR